MTHFAFHQAVNDASLYLTHLIFDAYSIFVQYIHNMWGIFSVFLCKMLICVVFFYMIFVQFLGVIKWFDNPFCTMCLLADTKKPHIKNFKASETFGRHIHTHTLKFSVVDIHTITIHISCVPLNRPTRFRISREKSL